MSNAIEVHGHSIVIQKNVPKNNTGFRPIRVESF